MPTIRHIKNSIPGSLKVIAMVGMLAAAPTSQAQDSGDAQLATMKQYCSGCHSDKGKIGGVTFEGINAASIAKNPELFEKAVRKLRGHVMPPPGARQPDAKAVDSLVAWLEESLDKLPTERHATANPVPPRWK